MSLDTTYLSTILPFLPQNLETNVHALVNNQTPAQSLPIQHTLDNFVRFVSGGVFNPLHTHPSDQNQWYEKQRQALRRIQELNSDNGNGSVTTAKRPREDADGDATSNGIANLDGNSMDVDSIQSTSSSHKRIRLQDGHLASNGIASSSAPTPSSTAEPIQEHPIYTLHSISTTSPVRKKVDITITASSIRFTNPSTQNLESSVPRSLLRRAFLLPTRGKPKPHWTVVLISSDSPGAVAAATSGMSTGTAAQQQQQNNPQVIFGIDATATAQLTVTSYDSHQSPQTQMISKGSPTETSLRTFLSHLPEIQLLEPSASNFKSACGQTPSGGGIPGIEAYRQAKVGSLWFMREGILWGESKPCEFWAVEDLLGKSEGLRLLSATGRTCSVFLTRKSGSGVNEGIGDSGAGAKEKGNGGATEEEGGVDDEEDLGIETEFGMVDGREQDPINRWVKEHRHFFGKKPEDEEEHAAMGIPALDKGKGKAVDDEDIKGKGKERRKEKALSSGPMTISQLPADEDDDEDDDFVGSDSSDQSSGSGSDSESDSGSGSDDAEALSEDVGSGESSDEDEDDEDGEAEEPVRGGGDGDAEEELDDEEEENLDPAHHPLLRPGAMPKMSRAALEMAVGIVNQDLLGGRGGQGDVEEDGLSEEDEEDELDE